MLKKISSTLTVLLLTASFTFAQKEQNNWFFGYNAALTWNTTRSYNGYSISTTGVQSTTATALTGIPSVISNSPLSTGEGCFSLSDVDGNLLFFSDGMTIWNRNLALMAGQTATGQLTGNGSSAQSGIVLPYPNNISRYIAISLGERAQNNPAYSIVDMSLASGLGQVTSLNTPLTGQSGTMGESITAVRHSNKTDFWVVGVGRGTSTYFNVWKVTSTGVQTTRFGVASIALNTSAYTGGPAGYIKFSPDGTRFAWAGYTPNVIVYGNFNPTTGAISGLKYRQHPATTYTSRPYGIEFSPDSKSLYVTYVAGSQNTSNYDSKLEIYTVSTLWAAATGNSLTPTRTFQLKAPLTSNKDNIFGAIQLGPDNRMYIGDFGFSTLYTLLNPNTPTSATLYIMPNVLGAGQAVLGLPSFTAPWFRMIITLPNTGCCSDVTTNFPLTIENGAGLSTVTRVVLNFGDGGANSVVTINNPTAGTVSYPYKYSKPGTYTITATATDAGGAVQLTQTATATVNSCTMIVNPQVRVRDYR